MALVVFNDHLMFDRQTEMVDVVGCNGRSGEGKLGEESSPTANVLVGELEMSGVAILLELIAIDGEVSSGVPNFCLLVTLDGILNSFRGKEKGIEAI